MILFINILSGLLGILNSYFVFIITLCAAIFYILSLKEGKRERRTYKKYETIAVPKNGSTFGEADFSLKIIRIVNYELSVKIFFKNEGKMCTDLRVESDELETEIFPKDKLNPNEGGYLSITLTQAALKNIILFRIKYTNSHKMNSINEYTFNPGNNSLEMTKSFTY